MEAARAFLRSLVDMSSDVHVTREHYESLRHLTPAEAQASSKDRSAFLMYMKKSVEQVVEQPSALVVHDLKRAWDLIISRDPTTSKPVISSSVDAGLLKSAVRGTAAVIGVINETEYCLDADQKLYMAADTLRRHINVAYKSPQYMASHADRSSAKIMTKHVRIVFDYLEESIAEVLLQDVLPETILERVRLEEECPVCRVTPLNAEANYSLMTNCTHAVCVPCSRRWFAGNSSCPLCRAEGFSIKKIKPREPL